MNDKREQLRNVGISEEMIEWILDEREFVAPCETDPPQFVQSVLSDPVHPLPAQAPGGPRRILVEVYSRVVGYFRPVNQWNKGKKEEFGDRRTYSLGGGRFELKGHSEAGLQGSSIAPSKERAQTS